MKLISVQNNCLLYCNSLNSLPCLFNYSTSVALTIRTLAFIKLVRKKFKDFEWAEKNVGREEAVKQSAQKHSVLKESCMTLAYRY